MSDSHPQSQVSMSLSPLAVAASNYAAARDLLGNRVQQLMDEQQAAKRRAMPAIRTALAAASAAQAELMQLIEDGKALFKKPKTHVFHGVTIGYQRAPGRVVIDDEELTLRLIRQLLPDQLDFLTKTEVTLKKAALQELDADVLKAIGVRKVGVGDVPVIKVSDSALNKMLSTLLKSDDIKTLDDDGASTHA